MNDRLRTRGHEAARRAVVRWIARGSPPHAILFSGPANVGKTTLALDLAAGLLCLADDPGERPCWSCIACRKVERGVHPDVHRLAPQGAGDQIRIAAARALGAELALLPIEGRRRIAIVESAQRLNEDAQNALLKTLEEPPVDVVLVLCADDEEPILPTVRSRCVRLPMPPLSAKVVATILAEHGVDEPGLAARVARLAEGRPGIALLIAAQPELERTIGRVARRLIDLTSADRRTRLGAAGELIADGATLARLDLPAEGPGGDGSASSPQDEDPAAGRGPAAPSQRRRAVSALFAVWRGIARDLAVAARGGRGQVRWIGLVDELEAASSGLEPGAAERFLERIERVSALVEANANPELALDTLLLAWPRRRAVEVAG